MVSPVFRRIGVKGYRCFRRWTQLELRPMTLLLGRNSAGKSTLLRSTRVLERSVTESAAAPWDLSGNEGGRASLLSAMWRGQRQMEVALGWEASLEDRFALRYEDHVAAAYVERLTILRDGQVVLELEALPHPDTGTFRVSSPESLQGAQLRLAFQGLVPQRSSEVEQAAYWEELDALRQRLMGLRRTVQWLDSTRAPVPHLLRAQGVNPVNLDFDGADAPQVLFKNQDILNEVNAWYARPTIRRSLRIEGSGQEDFRLLLDRVNETSKKINLADTGSGMVQVMPVLVAAALARRQGARAVLAVEDPEAHLHEDARRALAEHLCQIAATEEAPRLLLETHSRTFLLGVQVAIARGELPPEHVVAYWIDQHADGHSEVTQVTFDASGAPQTPALAGVLAEDRALARELLELQLSAP